MKRPRSRFSRRLCGIALGVAATTMFGVTRWAGAADHRDSMALTSDPAADIADVYSFISPTNPDNLVLAMTVSGLIPPAEARTTRFDRDVLYQFKIDNSGDAVEDLVIQAWVTGGANNQVIHFRGPVATDVKGALARVVRSQQSGSVRASTSGEAIVTQRGGMKFFAGVRDDPFFFDLVRFREVVGGQQSSFRDPGIDTFAGTNVLAIVVEVPVARLGDNPNLKIWGTTSRPN